MYQGFRTPGLVFLGGSRAFPEQPVSGMNWGTPRCLNSPPHSGAPRWLSHAPHPPVKSRQGLPSTGREDAQHLLGYSPEQRLGSQGWGNGLSHLQPRPWHRVPLHCSEHLSPQGSEPPEPPRTAPAMGPLGCAASPHRAERHLPTMLSLPIPQLQ